MTQEYSWKCLSTKEKSSELQRIVLQGQADLMGNQLERKGQEQMHDHRGTPVFLVEQRGCDQTDDDNRGKSFTAQTRLPKYLLQTQVNNKTVEYSTDINLQGAYYRLGSFTEGSPLNIYLDLHAAFELASAHLYICGKEKYAFFECLAL